MRGLVDQFLIYLLVGLLFASYAKAEEMQNVKSKGRMINGIDVEKANDFLIKLKENPLAGHVTFSSITHGMGGTKSMTVFSGYEIEGVIKKERKVQMKGEDLPELGGSDLVPVDVEEMMSAVGSSVIGVTSLKAALMGVELTKIEISLESDVDLMGSMELDIHKRPGVSDFRVLITIAGNADENTLRKIAMAGWKFSPVADTVRSGVTTVEIPKVVIPWKGFSFIPHIKKPEVKANGKEVLNGLVLKQVKDFVELVKENPKEGLITFFSKTKWEGGTKSITTITGYKLGGKMRPKREFTLIGQDIVGLGASDTIPGPIELLMHAVGACITAGTNEGAALSGLELSKIQVSLESDLDLHGMFELDPNVRPGLLNLRVTVTISGDGSDDDLKKAALGGYEMSTVADTVRNGVTTVVPPKIVVLR